MFMLSSDAVKILDLIPFGLITTDRDLVILHINRAARRLLRLDTAAELTGQPVGSIMDEAAFLHLSTGERTAFSDSIRISDGAVLLERSLLCDSEREHIVCTLRDVTHQNRQQELQAEAVHQAVQMAEQINEKHLQIVHDIAGLLGADAVETQKAVFELKQALLGKENDHA